MKNFISFEGVDGCGKTTQIRLLQEYFKTKGKKCYIVREPGDTAISEKIRGMLLDKKNKISPESETLLFLSARAQLFNEIVFPKLSSDFIVLCDRFIDSTMAYQGYGRGMDKSIITLLNDFATKNVKPCLTFILDVPLEFIQNRINKDNFDRIEEEGLLFQKKVRKGYIEISKENSKRCIVINCKDKNIIDIHKKIISIIEEYQIGDI